METLILAAGASTRLHPLTANRPKPMVPVAGKPILEWVLEAVRDAGSSGATVVVGHKAASVQSHVEDGRRLGLAVRFVHQAQQIGTAHAVATALADGGLPDAALVLDGDNVVDARLVRELVNAGADAIAVAKSASPARYGVVTAHGGVLKSITEKPPLRGEALVWTGACLLSRAALDRIVELVGGGVTDLSEALSQLAHEGRAIRTVVSSGEWLDAVEPTDLVPLTEILLSEDPPETTAFEGAVVEGAVRFGGGVSLGPRAIVSGPSSIGTNVRIGAGAIVSRSVIFDDAKIGPGAVVEGSVVAEGATIGAGAVLGVGFAASERDGPGGHAAVGSIVGEGSTVGPGAVLSPGTVLGVNVTVAPGVVVRGRIPDHGWVL